MTKAETESPILVARRMVAEGRSLRDVARYLVSEGGMDARMARWTATAVSMAMDPSFEEKMQKSCKV